MSQVLCDISEARGVKVYGVQDAVVLHDQLSADTMACSDAPPIYALSSHRLRQRRRALSPIGIPGTCHGNTEIRPATIALDDGEIVGHRILDYELSRQVVAGGKQRGHTSDSYSLPSAPQGSSAHRAGGGGRGDDSQMQEQEERRRQHIQMRENELNQQVRPGCDGWSCVGDLGLTMMAMEGCEYRDACVSKMRVLSSSGKCRGVHIVRFRLVMCRRVCHSLRGPHIIRHTFFRVASAGEDAGVVAGDEEERCERAMGTKEMSRCNA